jgi:hypothetical protein
MGRGIGRPKGSATCEAAKRATSAHPRERRRRLWDGGNAGGERGYVAVIDGEAWLARGQSPGVRLIVRSFDFETIGPAAA